MPRKKPVQSPPLDPWDGNTRFLIPDLREMTEATVRAFAAGTVPEEIRIVCQQCLDFWPELTQQKKEIA